MEIIKYMPGHKQGAGMAIYRLEVSSFSRARPNSGPGLAAYRSGTLITNNRDGRVHNYKRRGGVEAEFITTPPGCEWAHSRPNLWNAVETAETRKDAKIAREVLVALPAELDKSGRCELTRSYAAALVERYEVAIDVAIHAPHRRGDERNYHAHCLMTTRAINGERLTSKTRQLDVSTTAKVEVEWMRAVWENLVNKALKQAGSGERVTRLSHASRGTGLMPQIALGVAASAMERRGILTEKGMRNLEIAAFNTAKIAAAKETTETKARARTAERLVACRVKGARADTGGERSLAGHPRTALRGGRHDVSALLGSRQRDVATSYSRPADPVPTSFLDRQAASKRRMDRARAWFGIGGDRPQSPARFDVASPIERINDEVPQASLVSEVQAAWGDSASSAEVRYDLRGDFSAATRLLIELTKYGIKGPGRWEGKWHVRTFAMQDIARVAACLYGSEKEDFIGIVGLAGLASAAELKLQEAERLELSDAARVARVRDATENSGKIAEASRQAASAAPSVPATIAAPEASAKVGWVAGVMGVTGRLTEHPEQVNAPRKVREAKEYVPETARQSPEILVRGVTVKSAAVPRLPADIVPPPMDGQVERVPAPFLPAWRDPAGQGRDSLGRGLDEDCILAAVHTDITVQREQEALRHHLQGAYRNPVVAQAALDAAVKRDGSLRTSREIARDPTQFGDLRGKSGWFAYPLAKEERVAAERALREVPGSLRRTFEAMAAVRSGYVRSVLEQQARDAIEIPGLSSAAQAVLLAVKAARLASELPVEGERHDAQLRRQEEAVAMAWRKGRADPGVANELDRFMEAASQRLGEGGERAAHRAVDSGNPMELPGVLGEHQAGLAKLAHSFVQARKGASLNAQWERRTEREARDAERAAQAEKRRTRSSTPKPRRPQDRGQER